MSQDGAGQGGGWGGAGPTEQLPVGVAEVKGVDRVDGVLLKASQVLLEATTADLTLKATLLVISVASIVSMAVVSWTVVVGTAEVGVQDALGHVDHVGAALPSQGGLAAGRGGRLAVGAAVAARRRSLHRSDPDGGDSLRVGVEGRGEGDGGSEGQIGVLGVGVVGHRNVGVIETRIVGYQVMVLEVIGVVGV